MDGFVNFVLTFLLTVTGDQLSTNSVKQNSFSCLYLVLTELRYYMSTFKCCELQLFTILPNKAPAILNHIADKMLQEFIVWTSKIVNSTKSIVLNAELSGLCLIKLHIKTAFDFLDFLYGTFWTLLCTLSFIICFEKQDTTINYKIMNTIVICNLIIFINIKIPVALS